MRRRDGARLGWILCSLLAAPAACQAAPSTPPVASASATLWKLSELDGVHRYEVIQVESQPFELSQKPAGKPHCAPECVESEAKVACEDVAHKIQPELAARFAEFDGRLGVVAVLGRHQELHLGDAETGSVFATGEVVLDSGARTIADFLEAIGNDWAEHLSFVRGCDAAPLALFQSDARGVCRLASRPEVTYVQLDRATNSLDAVETAAMLQDGSSVEATWEAIGGEFALTGERLAIALLDNGVDPKFVESSRKLDLWGCGAKGCCAEGATPSCEVSDEAHRHGSLAWTVLDRLLPGAYQIRSYKVYSGRNLDASAYCRAVAHAVETGVQLIIAEVAVVENDRAVGQSAEGAVLAGVPVLAAAGNLGKGRKNPCCLTAPASSPTVVSVGARSRGATIHRQSRGPAPDGRIKPDLQAPTDSRVLIGGTRYSFLQTSGALPYLGALATRLAAWLVPIVPTAETPGHLWPLLLALGDEEPPFGGAKGAGLARYPNHPLTAWTGSLTIRTGQELSFPLDAAAGHPIAAAIWWPVGADSRPRADLDLCLVQADEEPQCSDSLASVFERATLTGPGRAVVRHNGPAGSTTVYFGAFEFPPAAP